MHALIEKTTNAMIGHKSQHVYSHWHVKLPQKTLQKLNGITLCEIQWNKLTKHIA
jgi:hypothetical protein